MDLGDEHNHTSVVYGNYFMEDGKLMAWKKRYFKYYQGNQVQDENGNWVNTQVQGPRTILWKTVSQGAGSDFMEGYACHGEAPRRWLAFKKGT